MCSWPTAAAGGMTQADRADVPADLRQPGARATARRRGASDPAARGWPSPPILRGQPALLPRRRYRLAGGPWHDQRPGDVRRAAARALRRLHPRRRAAHGAALADRPVDADAPQHAAGVPIVTGDTKVVDRGKGDGIFINTAGIGADPGGSRSRRAGPGPATRCSSAARSRRMASRSCRCARDWSSRRRSRATRRALQSWWRRSWKPAASRCMCCAIRRAAASPARSTRSPRRRAWACGWTSARSRSRKQVRGACEILGLDPLYVANEGKCLAIVAPEAADAVLAAMRAHPLGRDAAIIGEVVAEHPRQGIHAQPHRRRARRRHAQRRAAPPHLLSNRSSR